MYHGARFFITQIISHAGFNALRDHEIRYFDPCVDGSFSRRSWRLDADRAQMGGLSASRRREHSAVNTVDEPIFRAFSLHLIEVRVAVER